MIQPVVRMLSMPWASLLGVFLGITIVLAIPAFVGPLRDTYDEYFPVMNMTGALESRDIDSAILRIKGQKVRGDECRLLSTYGYSIQPDGFLKDASAIRVDRPATGRVRDKGYYDIGLWRVHPVETNAVGAQVVMQHDCVGRVVLSTVADVRF